MFNRYGGNLRELITNGFSVETGVEMHRAGAFFDEVLAYPAITVIRRKEQSQALVARLDDHSAPAAVTAITSVAQGVSDNGWKDTGLAGAGAVVVDKWCSESDPWPCVPPERLGLLQSLEAEFPPVEDMNTGTRVGAENEGSATRTLPSRISYLHSRLMRFAKELATRNP